MSRFLLAIVLTTVAVSIICQQNLTEPQRKILNAVDARDHLIADTELRTYEEADPGGFLANDYDYLAGRIAESRDDMTRAMMEYQQVANRDSVLRPYALMHLSQIVRSTGNLLLERIYLRELMMFAPDSPLANFAGYRLAQSNFESQNYAETIRLLNDKIQSTAKPAVNETFRRERLALLANAYLNSGQTQNARELFTGLMTSSPSLDRPDDVAMEAAKSLDLMDGGTSEKAPSLTEAEHLKRAVIFQFNQDVISAKRHYEAILADGPAGQNTPDAIFQIGRGLLQQSEFVEAISWFERVQEQFPDSGSAKEALLQAASAYARVGKPREAIRRYQKFIEKYPSDEKLDRAYLNIVDILRDQGEDSEALKWTTKTRDAFRGHQPEAVALFAEARIYIAREEWQNANDALNQLSNYSDLGGSTVPGGTNRNEIVFLKAFTLEQLGRYYDAIDAYLSLDEGRAEYYGWRATQRLRSMENDETSKGFVAQKLGLATVGMNAPEADARKQNALIVLRLSDAQTAREKALTALKSAFNSLSKYQGIPDLQASLTQSPTAASKTAGSKLLSLGLYDEAIIELAPVTADSRPAYMADLYRRGDHPDRAIAYIEPLWHKVPADYPIALIPRDQVKLLYPAPWADVLIKFSHEKGVDPRLILAIMRQESRFQPDAKSIAAARGLMQFISKTALQVAGELGRRSFRQDELYYVPTAIRFGSQYVSDLFGQFPDLTDAVVASYNGGDDNMKRWLARSRSNMPERYVSEIAYAQSKDYVYKVMANYYVYKSLYDENLKLK